LARPSPQRALSAAGDPWFFERPHHRTRRAAPDPEAAKPHLEHAEAKRQRRRERNLRIRNGEPA
jgi:hypothetical protein